MNKFTKLPASPYLAESGEKPEEIICTGILTDRGTIKVDLSLLDYFEVGEKVKVTIFLSDQEDPAL